jgi:hypothetical protein
MTLTEVYDSLPMTARTLWKRLDRKAYSGQFELINDLGPVNLFRVVVNGADLGVVQYASDGRKLCCHRLKTVQPSPLQEKP